MKGIHRLRIATEFAEDGIVDGLGSVESMATSLAHEQGKMKFTVIHRASG